MISIRKTSNVSLREMVSRSPVADMPNAEYTLTECVTRSSEVQYGYVDDEVACMWGLIPPTLLSQTAYLWLLTTDLVDAHRFLFVRHSQRWLEETLKVYPVIVGSVAIDNHSARKWLSWLGAQFSTPDRGMIRFAITRKLLNG